MTQPQSSSTGTETETDSTTTPSKTMSTETTKSISQETLKQIRDNKTRIPDTDITETTEPHPQSETTGLSCEECGGAVIRDEEIGERACEECGLILEDTNGNVGPSWERTSAVEHIVNATVTTNTDSGVSGDALGGTIDWRDKDGYGESLSAKNRSLYHRRRSIDRQANADNRKRSEYNYGLGEINRIGTQLSVPTPVIDAGTEMFELLVENDNLSGKSIDTVAASVLLIACEMMDNTVRSTDEVAELTHTTSEEIEVVKNDVTTLIGTSDLSKQITEYVGEFCNEMNAGSDARRIAERILKTGVDSELFDDGDLEAYTAAAVFIGCIRSGVIRQQSEIAAQTEVSQSQLKEKYEELIEGTEI